MTLGRRLLPGDHVTRHMPCGDVAVPVADDANEHIANRRADARAAPRRPDPKRRVAFASTPEYTLGPLPTDQDGSVDPGLEDTRPLDFSRGYPEIK